MPKVRRCASPIRTSPIATRSIRYARGRYYLVDLKSEPGTFVNGRRIRRTQRLKHGDVLRFGTATPYRFIDPDAQKRRRWRRNLRASAVVAVLLAVGLVDHFEQWGLSPSRRSRRLPRWWIDIATAKRVEAPIAVAVSAPVRPAAPSASCDEHARGRRPMPRTSHLRHIRWRPRHRSAGGATCIKYVRLVADDLAGTDQLLSAPELDSIRFATILS